MLHVRSVVVVVTVIIFKSTAKHDDVSYTALTQEKENRLKWVLCFWSQGELTKADTAAAMVFCGSGENVYLKKHIDYSGMYCSTNAHCSTNETRSVLACSVIAAAPSMRVRICVCKALQKKYTCAFARSTLPISNLDQSYCALGGVLAPKGTDCGKVFFCFNTAPTGRAQ